MTWLDLGLCGSVGDRGSRFQLGHGAVERGVEAFGQFAGRLRPVLRVLRQTLEDELLDFPRHPAREAQFGERRRHARWRGPAACPCCSGR